MYRITEFNQEKRIVPLTIPNQSNYDENTFTVIVGKNGVGKSRLLSNMVSTFIIKERVASRYDITDDTNPLLHRNEGRVIAVSTSPFDKFKMPPKNRFKDSIASTNYRYIGMRSGGPYGASAISLISSATKGLLDRFLRNENYDRLRDVFKTLGFFPEVRLIFKQNFTLNRYKLSADDINGRRNYIETVLLNEFGIEPSSRTMENLSEINEKDLDNIRNALHTLGELLASEKAISVDLDFGHGEAFSINKATFHNVGFLESINILLNFNMIRLMDLRLHKEEYGDMSLRRASSGEQCMLVMMLGIAGHIRDNSLIFIDEPEISLHPKWQEEFMSLLVRTFSKYRACQFFIATHSPQIVSRLKGNNCFVTSLTENKVYSSSHFYERSSDFQLAELFDAPGFRNEYITRLAFALLSKVKKQRNAQYSEMKELDRLLGLCNSIGRDDPIFDLIKSVEEVVHYYASY